MRWKALELLAVVLSIGSLAGCHHGNQAAGLPQPGTPAYQQVVSAFYTGVLALQVGVDPKANQIVGNKLLAATRLAPQEPATWADLGLYRLQANDLASAGYDLDKAHSLAPTNGQIEAMLGQLEMQQNNVPAALDHFRNAVNLEPNNIQARYALVQALGQQPEGGHEIEDNLQKIVQIRPQNLAAQVELALAAAKNGDAALLRQTLNSLQPVSANWPDSTRSYLAAARKAAAGPDPRAATTQIIILQNVLKQVPAFKESADALKAPQILDRFVRLTIPPLTPAPPDTALRFSEQPIPNAVGNPAFVRSVVLRPELPTYIAGEFRLAPVTETPPSVLLADGRQVRLLTADGKTLSLPFPGGPAATPPTPEGVLPLDLTYSFREDLALVGAGGVRLYHQSDSGSFTDVTVRSKLPASVLNAAYTGAWPVDIESDGDLDMVLAAVHGPPVVLRNNGDGTFAVMNPFPGVANLRAFAWADLDGDGVPDAALLDDQGKLTIFRNERSGHFRALPLAPDLGKLTALSITDADPNGVLDLAALRPDGSIVRIAHRPDGSGWDTAEIARWQQAPSDGSARLLWADLDNNGCLDLIATGSTGSQIWLTDEKGSLQPLSAPFATRAVSIVLPSNNGRLDLIGVSAAGQPVRLVNSGAKNYHWQDVQPRATYVAPHQQAGDNRINSFGVGGEIETRAGLLYQKQPLTGPNIHFGLGNYAQIDAVRIIWPDGSPSGEFDWKGDQSIVAEQRLKGSCPWLFAFNGKKMELVSDFIWKSPLGLKINAQTTAGVSQTQDWVKIRGDQLVARNGFYDLSITAELWETHYFDYLALMTVDHPVGTDIYVDERFALPPPPLAIYATAPARPFARATDDLGNDVTGIVRAVDGRYLDTFGRGPYQGITRDHYVELELGPDVPKTGKLWLVAKGWIHPTDSSINVAISQGHHVPPQGLSLEVPDGKGGWRVARSGLGFPAGKVKTILLDLTGIFKPGAPRRLRLRTNLEIYWDFLGWAQGLPKTPLKRQQVSPAIADLRYRGFSVTHQPSRSAPEWPDYDHLCSKSPYWLDLEGYYTRYGDVRPLVQKIDDRYVIMNAGDELFLRFPAPPPPPAGWTRDFVMIGDGWEKDGNLNTTFSSTVLPLPSHSVTSYDTPPGRLEDDPVYRRHAQDWRDYHTRYVTSQPFHDAMRPLPLP